MEQVPLTKKQRGLLEVLLGRGQDGAPLSDLAREMGLARESSVREHLDVLVRFGLAERREVLPYFKPALITQAGCRWLGLRSDAGEPEQIVEPDARRLMREYELVHAGEAGVEFEASPRLVTLEGRLGVRPDDDYLLPVVGSCMTPIFREGDVVIIRPDERPPDGTLVHVDVQLSNAWEPLLRVFEADESQGAVWLTHVHPERQTVCVPGERVRVRGHFLGFWRDAQGAYEMLRDLGRDEARAELRAAPSVQRVRTSAPKHLNTTLNSNGVRR